MRLATGTLVVIGCTRVTPTAPSNVAAQDEHLPTLYAALFQTGRSWRFSSILNDNPRDIVCKVTEARQIRGGWASTIDCMLPSYDSTKVGFGIPNRFVGTATGLWVTDHAIDDAAQLDPAALALPRRPHAYARQHDIRSVFAIDDGWCFSIERQTRPPEPTIWGWTLCLRPGTGLIGGAAYLYGMAVTASVRFGSLPE